MMGMALMMHLVLAEVGADVAVGALMVVLVMVRMMILGVEAAILGLWAAVERKRHDTMLFCHRCRHSLVFMQVLLFKSVTRYCRFEKMYCQVVLRYCQTVTEYCQVHRRNCQIVPRYCQVVMSGYVVEKWCCQGVPMHSLVEWRCCQAVMTLYCQIVERCCQAMEMDCQALRLSCLVVWMHY